MPSQAIPFGYKLAPDSREQRVIQRIRRMEKAGMSQLDIANKLNAEGVKIRGKEWQQPTVCRILKRVEVRGTR